MRDALMRQEDVVQKGRERGQIGRDHLHEVIRFTGHGEGLLHFLHALHQLLEAPGIVRRMGRERHLHEGDDAEAQRPGSSAAW